ncbi:MAG: type II toxin-antitoxin system HicB family antitoxin [Chloroflexota bacterium]|nr:type II toxin-antitoxin system HicB family antitoxin [Chloroflexota bacterium]
MTHEVERYDGHTIVYDHDDGENWGAYVEDLPVCFTVADTREACGQQIREAIAVYLDALHRDIRERPALYEARAEPTA